LAQSELWIPEGIRSAVTATQQLATGANMAIKQGATDAWTKSSYSQGNGACVEVKSPVLTAIAVRDSKVHEGPALAFPADSWNAFVSEVSRGTV
jgi:hypothetical protein